MKRPQFVSYPKSGRTWIRYALHQLDLAEQIKFHHDTFEFNDGSKPAPNTDFEARLAWVTNSGPIVYLERDPRDVLVSLYFQVTGRFRDFFGYEGTLSDFIRDDYFGAKHLRIFRDQWQEICRQGLALPVTYEDCHRDLGANLTRILTHFDFPIDRTAVGKAVASSSFDEMKMVEQSQQFERAWLRPRNDAPKVREGKVGGYRNQFSEADLHYLDQMFGSNDRG